MAIRTIGKTKLRCSICESDQFLHLPEVALDMSSVIACDKCGVIGEAKEFAKSHALTELVKQVLEKARMR